MGHLINCCIIISVTERNIKPSWLPARCGRRARAQVSSVDGLYGPARPRYALTAALAHGRVRRVCLSSGRVKVVRVCVYGSSSLCHNTWFGEVVAGGRADDARSYAMSNDTQRWARSCSLSCDAEVRVGQHAPYNCRTHPREHRRAFEHARAPLVKFRSVSRRRLFALRIRC